MSGDREEEEVEAERPLQWGWTGSDTCMEERKREQSKLVDPLCLGDQEGGHGPNREEAGRKSWMGK